MKTDDLRIVKIRPLLSPAILAEEIPLTDTASTRVYEARRAIEAILDGTDARFLVVVGPCSVHDTKAGIRCPAHCHARLLRKAAHGRRLEGTHQ